MAQKTSKRQRNVTDGLLDEERRALALVFAEAAQDPEFEADNEAVERDFAMLDHEVEARLG